MRPLAEIVAEIESAIKDADDPSLEIRIDNRADTWALLCAAFRAAEKMRDCAPEDDPDEDDLTDKQLLNIIRTLGSRATEWDRVTGGAE